MAPRKKTQVRRGPGRPPNPKPDDGMPKRRGRPPGSVNRPAVSSSSAAPKRRGRPPKDEKAATAKKAFPLIGRNDLRRLLEEAAIYKNRASSASGSRSELIGEYVQRKHLHAGAFRIIASWVKMGEDDPQKLWLLLAHLDDMRQKAGIDSLAEKQGQLLPAIEDEGEPVAAAESDKADESEPPLPMSGNVSSFPREVEERAGDAA